MGSCSIFSGPSQVRHFPDFSEGNPADIQTKPPQSRHVRAIGKHLRAFPRSDFPATLLPAAIRASSSAVYQTPRWRAAGQPPRSLQTAAAPRTRPTGTGVIEGLLASHSSVIYGFETGTAKYAVLTPLASIALPVISPWSFMSLALSRRAEKPPLSSLRSIGVLP